MDTSTIVAVFQPTIPFLTKQRIGRLARTCRTLHALCRNALATIRSGILERKYGLRFLQGMFSTPLPVDRKRVMKYLDRQSGGVQLYHMDLIERITVIIHDWNYTNDVRISLYIDSILMESVVVDESNICYIDNSGTGMCVVVVDWFCKYSPFNSNRFLSPITLIVEEITGAMVVQFSTILYGWKIKGNEWIFENYKNVLVKRKSGRYIHIIRRRFIEQQKKNTYEKSWATLDFESKNVVLWSGGGLDHILSRLYECDVSYPYV